METYLLLGCIGIFTGFISGLLGIGGGILMAPLLLYVPPLFGLEPYSMRTVAGLTIVMALLGCLSGGLTHRKFFFVSNQLAAYMGSSIFIAALMGGAATRFVSNAMLLFIFSCLAFVAAILMLAPTKGDVENPNAANLEFCKTRAVTAATGVGLLGGLVGQGGSFILIPLMTAYVKVPTRIAIGSNLAIVFLSSLAAFIGKAITGQIEWILSIPIVLTVLPAASVGGYVSQKVPVKWLRKLLAVLIGLAAVRMLGSFLL
ncbi:MAG: sulfite exporter TauE/SafE family protein [Desulfobacterales bacterium]|nr:sulfite exporter TauE/SafE family protein [Desulfobacterales bacterium]